MSPGQLSRYAFVVSTDGVLAVQTSRLALVGGDQHAEPGMPVDLVDVGACPMRFVLGFGDLDGEGAR